MRMNKQIANSDSGTAASRLKVVEGFKLPHHGQLTKNERLWIENLRAITRGRDPSPTLRAIQALRVALSGS